MSVVSVLLLQFHSHLKLLETLLDLTCTINAINFNLVLVALEYLKNLIRSKPDRLLCIAKLLNVLSYKSCSPSTKKWFLPYRFLGLQYCFPSTKLCQAIWEGQLSKMAN